MILIFSFSFYSKYQRTQVDKNKQENFALRSIEISQHVSFLPEIQCGFGNVPVVNCIDILKADALSGIINKTTEDSLYFFRSFSYSTISIEEIYPNNTTRILYDYPGNWTSKTTTQIPISLYNTTSDEYYFGILKVEVYI